ncbi:hypothetical protein [Streptomyces racemochromogenes]|uniref:hypothetical protein n=1 Tax=Streptomyces racemochromogenes TaxID=67353 RepID=UPI0031F19925
MAEMNPNGETFQSGRSLRAKGILERFAPLSWFRHPLERHPRLGHLQITHLGWRFADPHEEFIPTFEAATRYAPRRVSWEFKAVKNWLILPTRLAEETQRNGDDFSHAQMEVTKDQDFCLAASQDMDLILQALDDGAPH